MLAWTRRHHTENAIHRVQAVTTDPRAPLRHDLLTDADGRSGCPQCEFVMDVPIVAVGSRVHVVTTLLGPISTGFVCRFE